MFNTHEGMFQKKHSGFSVPPPCFHQGSLQLADTCCLFVFMLFPVSVIDSLCCVSTLELLTIYLTPGLTEFLDVEVCASPQQLCLRAEVPQSLELEEPHHLQLRNL